MIDAEYYEVLGVERSADDRAIKSAYRKLAMQYHPDKNGGCRDSEAKFKAISEAYDCLKDPQKRAAYDRFGKAAFQHGAGGGSSEFTGFSDIFDNIFGDIMGMRGGRGRSASLRGADLRYDLEVSLEDAFAGKQASVQVTVTQQCEPCSGSGAAPGTAAHTCTTCGGMGKVRAQQGLFLVERTCPSCRGAGQIIEQPCDSCFGAGRVQRDKLLEVQIPAGVDDGTRIRLSGEGEAGLRGGPPGDLYIFLHVRPHDVFKREGATLFAAVPLSFTSAALGGTIEVPCLDRETATIRIPEGTQTGRQFRIRGRGMPALNSYGKGDLVIQVEVETPINLSKRQRELLEEFQAAETGDTCPRSTGFFAKLKDLWGEITE